MEKKPFRYERTNGDTQQIYHNISLFGIRVSATATQLVKSIIKFFSYGAAVTYFMFKFVVPIYLNVESIPIIQKDVVIIKNNQDTLKQADIKTNIKVDSLMYQHNIDIQKLNNKIK